MSSPRTHVKIEGDLTWELNPGERFASPCLPAHSFVISSIHSWRLLPLAM